MNVKCEPRTFLRPAVVIRYRRTMRWVLLGSTLLVISKCIACVAAYVALLIGAAGAAAEWCSP